MNPKFLPRNEIERRWHLAEECAEVIKELSKIGRFGLEGDAFATMPGARTPKERLIEELKDLELAIAQVRKDLNPWNDPVENG